MNIVAEIPKNYNEVAFYNKETNQLIGQSQMVRIGDKQLVFATIYGDTSNNILAKLTSKDQVVNATNALIFKSNAVIGSLDSPLQLTVPEELTLELNTYPNPFIDKLTIGFSATSTKPTFVAIYDQLGAVIYQHTYEAPIKEIVFTDFSGIRVGKYVLHVISSGKPFATTIVKE
jgi:hypothetical protein